MYTLPELYKITDAINQHVYKKYHYINVERILDPKNGFIDNNKLTIPAFVTNAKEKIVLDINNILRGTI